MGENVFIYTILRGSYFVAVCVFFGRVAVALALFALFDDEIGPYF